MDKAIEKGFRSVKKSADKQEKKLVRMDKKRDRACEEKCGGAKKSKGIK